MLNLSNESEFARCVKGLKHVLIFIVRILQPTTSEEIFTAIDISKRGFVFLRDVVEVLRYIKEDSSLDQVRMKSLTLLCPKLNGLGNYITFETL